MQHFRKLFLTLLLAGMTALPHSCRAALIRTYDLDSLCFMSTDIVEVTLVRHHTPGKTLWQDTLSATVIDSIAGKYHPGDHIAPLDWTEFDPAAPGQRCFLFLARRQYYLHLQTPTIIAPGIADMLLIDSHGHVRRYFQWGDPGGLVAEGYLPFHVPTFGTASHEGGTHEQNYPTVAEERATLVSKWTAVNALRPLLSHEPRPQDIPVLLKLLRERWSLRKPKPSFFSPHILEDGLAEVIGSRLADLRDPALALDALAADPDPDAHLMSGLTTIPFDTDKSLDYARAVLADPQQKVDRRLAAAEVLEEADSGGDAGKRTKQADRATATAMALADDTPEPLRLALIPNLNLKQRETADALRQSYHRTSSQEIQFAIEKAFATTSDNPAPRQDLSLKSVSGLVISIVRASPDLPVKPGFVGLMQEIIYTKAGQSADLSQEYVFTNTDTGKVFRVDLGFHDIYGGFSDEQVPLPKSLPKGLYRIALEFREKNRLISTGHSVTMALPGG